MRILVDIDGVCADYSGGYLRALEEVGGGKRRHDEITQWNTDQALGLSREMSERVLGRIMAPGFVRGLENIPGAVAGLDSLRQIGQLFAVTAPWPGHPTWMPEREQWLRHRMAIDHKHVVHTHAKHLVTGDVLIDDKPEHVYTWLEHNPGKLGLLFDAPYNQGQVERGRRVCGWPAVVVAVLEQFVALIK